MNNTLGTISLLLAAILWGVALGPVIGVAIFFTLLWAMCTGMDIANALYKTIANSANAIASKTK